MPSWLTPLMAFLFSAITAPPLLPPPPPPQHELNNNDTDSKEEELIAEVVLNKVDDEFEAWWTQCGGGAVMAENRNAIRGVNHDGITIKHVCDQVVSNFLDN